MSKRTHYDVLKIKPDATQKEIKQSYRKQRDKLQSKSSARAEQKRTRLEEAHAILSDKKKRKAYDKLHATDSGTADTPTAKTSQIGSRPRRARPRRPIRDALQLVWRHKWLWIRIGVLAMLIDWLFIFFVIEEFDLGQGLWRAAMISVLFWAAGRLSFKSNNNVTARQAFYQGPHAVVKQFLIFFFWMICLLGFVLGTLYFELVATGLIFPTQTELAVATTLMFLFGLTGFYLVLRTLFATVLIQELTPVQSIKRSWVITRGRAWWLTLRVAGGIVIALFPSLLLYALLYAIAGSGMISDQTFYVVELFSVSGLSFIATLPILVTVIDQLYEHEKPRRTRRTA